MKSDFRLNHEILVYGSGTFALSMISELEDLGHVILGVIDHQNIGKNICGRNTIYPVRDLSEVDIIDGVQIVLAICNLHGDLTGISSRLPLHADLVSPVKLFRYFAHKGLSLENYWLTTNFKIYSDSVSEIAAFRESLADENSKILFDAIKQYRQFGEIFDLPFPRPLSEQYLAEDLSTPPKELMVIDLGACRGENLADFIAAGFRFSGGFLLEPDESNLAILTEQLRFLNIETLSTHKLGAWKETTTLRFDATGNTGATLALDGIAMVDVVALDEFVPAEFVPNFVKLDIEGAELEALEGMSGLIQTHTPHLAVSVYHKPSDLWVLGNFLSQKFPNKYDFYLRVYGHQTFDTLLYAVPRK